MTSVKELRELALVARRENLNERLDRYVRARDEAFEILTDGVMERVKEAAKQGRFRYPIYRWTNKGRNETDTEVSPVQAEDGDGTQGVPEATQLYFGNDEGGKNGLHIMALMQPTGIPYEEMLVSRLREYFNKQMAPSDEGDEQSHRRNQLRVFLQKHPLNPRKCAIFVSWDRYQSAQVPAHRGPFVPRPQSAPVVPREGAPVNVGQRLGGKFGVVVGNAPFQRGTAPFRGGAPRGRGRFSAPAPRQ